MNDEEPMNEQAKWWAGVHGREYLKRNRVDWRARIPFWHDIMKFTGARSVYEVGCGAGWNLSAIQEGSPHKVGLRGCDINDVAARTAEYIGLDVEWGQFEETDNDERHWDQDFEIVFTAGVLIHIAPENLSHMMKEIIAASSHYVLAIEYAAEQEEMIDYRGTPNLLWKRPYGKMYEDMGLKIVASGDAEGFDRCTYWLCEKP